jgi:hypothetical protein
MLRLTLKYRLKIALAALAFTALVFSANALESPEAQAYANFIRELIDTASTLKQGPTCVFGSDEIAKVILAQNSRSISLAQNPEKAFQCKAVYIAKGSEKIMKSEIAKFNKSNIMTVGVFEGFVENGGMVQVQMGRRNFEITLNSKEARLASVRLSALILSFVIN